MTEVKVKTPIYPTESKEKVKKAIRNFFPTINIKIQKKGDIDYLTGDGTFDDLKKLKELILEQKISDTARSVLKKNSFKFSLNKQSALVEKVNFKENAPLGTIYVEINDINNENELINWLAPKTKDGEPIRSEKR
ncbi:MAG: putative RNA binding protein with dsRBD fold [Candidatus Methanohalarchaeum thermophilum]|uniref:UPF0201 protein BTN85_0348 n=1 Tax=Methanohalarchaeum thermophilum TaxID=1903181 RepID=A0A1Q6DU67_METT1|nr:MAG: putative RNA binding protein with dsRBD fold [Candidatus Methanohalarchaeum thermophilum]